MSWCISKHGQFRRHKDYRISYSRPYDTKQKKNVDSYERWPTETCQRCGRVRMGKAGAA